MDKMYNTRVPDEWIKYSWQSNAIGNWFKELVERDVQYKKWLNNGRPKAYWISGFFNPQAFLTAMKQEVRRAKFSNYELDKINFNNTVLNTYKEDNLELSTV